MKASSWGTFRGLLGRARGLWEPQESEIGSHKIASKSDVNVSLYIDYIHSYFTTAVYPLWIYP